MQNPFQNTDPNDTVNQINNVGQIALHMTI